jgi:hypothetical protein
MMDKIRGKRKLSDEMEPDSTGLVKKKHKPFYGRVRRARMNTTMKPLHNNNPLLDGKCVKGIVDKKKEKKYNVNIRPLLPEMPFKP